MPRPHPTDEQGRILPDPAWPGREAPGDLEFVRRFLNTRNRENGADRLATPLGLGEFLQSQGRPAHLPDPADLARVVAVREGLHAMVVSGGPGSGDDPGVRAALAGVRLGVVMADGALALEVVDARPTDRLLAELARAVVVARLAGTFARLTACAHCRWVVWDASANRSGRWCSMDACGGRHNARAYRRRRRAAGPRDRG